MNVIQSKVLGYPSPLGPVVLAHVLTQDTLGQVAAYVAVLADAGRAEFDLDWVAHHGSKLTERQAREVFTFPDATDYRR